MTARLRGRLLSAVKVRGLIAVGGHSPDPEFSREFMCTAFKLAGGESLLVFENGRGVLYDSREELAQAHRERAALACPQRNEPVLVDAETFGSRVPELISRLPALLGIQPTSLDRTKASLDLLDSAIRRLGPEAVLEPNVFSGLCAYLGEVIRATKGGAWTTEVGSGGESIPCVVDATGRKYMPTRIYKEILEFRRRASLRAFVEALGI